MKTKLIAIASVFTLTLACSPKIQLPSEDKLPPPPEIPMSPELVEGKTLFLSNCSKCHDLYSPKDFNAEQWKPIMLSMQKKAEISDEEREKIYAYLTK
jgi:mono/diheme cytochrome c family protein